MISVSITTYPRGLGERTITVKMPGAPRVGDSVSVGDENIATMRITHVTWVYDEDKDRWHIECSAS